MTERKASRTAFKPGQSGNPAGKPKGSRNHATRAVLALLEGEAEKITRTCIEAALSGDMTAMRLVLERLTPPARERPITIKLPLVRSADDAAGAQAAVLAAVANGELTPGEGRTLADIVEGRRKAIETAELEQRIIALEEAGNAKA